jgi:hypothetical protein
MNNKIKILDRIKKLLAVAQGKGGTANEVAVAAALAAQLMQAHKLTEADIPTDATDGPDMVDLPAGADFLDSWKFVLVTCVARSFMCEAVGLRSAGRRKVRVVGRREDVEVALEVYRHLAGEVDRLTAAYDGDDEWAREVDEGFSGIFGGVFDYYEEDMGPTDRVRANIEGRHFGDLRPGGKRKKKEISPERRAAYRDGLVAGIATKLREQKTTFEESSEKALVVARKSRDEIRGYISTKFAEPQKVERGAQRPESMEELDFVRGFVRGQEVAVPAPTRTKTATAAPGTLAAPETPETPEVPEAPEAPEASPKKRKVVVQKWEESERGWGCRPDGYSIHPDEAARRRYVDAYWADMPDETPDEYSRPNGTPYEAEVDVPIEGDGRRFFEHETKGYPGDGGKDGWVRGK